MTNVLTSAALRVPPAPAADAVSFFTARLTFQADVSDVSAALSSGAPGFVLVDSRGERAWRQGHVPGALHLPTADIPARAGELLDPDVPVITYCWGPGCDGATRAALALAQLGYRVKEMIGGIEYWIREGFAVETPGGDRQRRPADPLTAPADAITCDC
jgi:rhodanese-related sulfurtransferase